MHQIRGVKTLYSHQWGRCVGVASKKFYGQVWRSSNSVRNINDITLAYVEPG